MHYAIGRAIAIIVELVVIAWLVIAIAVPVPNIGVSLIGLIVGTADQRDRPNGKKNAGDAHRPKDLKNYARH